MHTTTPLIFPAPATSYMRRTAAGVKADRRSPAGLGLDPGEDRRTLATAGTAKTQNTSTKITCIMPMSGSPIVGVMRVIFEVRGVRANRSSVVSSVAPPWLGGSSSASPIGEAHPRAEA